MVGAWWLKHMDVEENYRALRESLYILSSLCFLAEDYCKELNNLFFPPAELAKD